MNIEQFEDEIQNRVESELTAYKLAQIGNPWAIKHVDSVMTGKKGDLSSIIHKEPCKHNARLIGSGIAEGWQVEAQICAQCGKTIFLGIKKPKKPQRGF